MTLRVAWERINEARAIRGISESAYWPAVFGTGYSGVTRVSEDTTPVLPDEDDRESTFNSLGVDVAWELDLWGRVRRSVESSDASLQAQEEQFRDTLIVLAADVALSYIELRSIQQQITWTSENVRTQQESLKIATARNDAGIVEKLDVHQAELNLANSRALLPSLRSAERQVIHRLSILTGQVPSALLETLIQPKPIPASSKAFSVGVPMDILRKRPDIRQAERNVAAQNALIGVATAELYPAFSIPGTFSLEAKELGDVLNGENLAYNFGLGFSWNLFNAGRVRNQIKVEESRTKQALLVYENTVLLAMGEVESALVSLQQERLRLVQLQQAVDAAKKSVGLVQVQYKEGITNFQNVLDMERSLTQQANELAASKGKVSQDLVRLYTALGGGWDPDAADSEDEAGTEEK